MPVFRPGTTISLLVDFIRGTVPLVERVLEVGMNALHGDRRCLAKVYQAAYVGDLEAIRRIVRELGPVADLGHVPCLTRRVLEPHALEQPFGRTLDLEPGDLVRLRIHASASDPSALPEPLRFDPRRPDRQWLEHGVEPHVCIGAAFAETVLASLLGSLFALQRVASFSAETGRLELRALPSDPRGYTFEIFGSSPPWSLSEEKIWLLDAAGVKHVQRNIMGVTEILGLLLRRKTHFYDESLFYVAWDREHEILLGSSYGGAWPSVLEMGDELQLFLTRIGQPVSLKPVSDFRSHPDYEDYVRAYSDIRQAYYIWAYFMVFLEGANDFVVRALFGRAGFRPLRGWERGALRFALGTVSLLMKLPLVGSRLERTFRESVDRQNGLIHPAVEILDRILSDGRSYIFGDEFSVADIQLCATMGNLVVPPEFKGGGVLAPLDDVYPASYRREIEALRETRTGQYAARVYREHRLAHRATARI